MSITVVICAYNAAETILQAIDSVDDPQSKILVINDDSQDDTLKLLAKLPSNQLKIISHDKNKGLSTARQTAIDNIETDFGIWLDADDEFLPNRIKELKKCLLEENCDLVFDQAEQWDKQKQIKIRDLPTPDFMLHDQTSCRLFERNYLPAPGCPAFRVQAARKIGYDTNRKQSEDYDFNLRAIKGKLRFHFTRFKGYKLNSHNSSLSRNLPLQAELICQTLKKFSYREIQGFYINSGYSRKIAQWASILISINRKEPHNALRLLKDMESDCKNNFDIIELGGPLPFTENWKWYFYKAISELMLSKYKQAIHSLEKAISIRESPELFNNIGYAHAKTGNSDLAKQYFQHSLLLHSAYNDAAKNEKAIDIKKIQFTLHPLRVHPSRMEYKV